MDHHFSSELAPSQLLDRLQKGSLGGISFSEASGTVPVYFKLDGSNFTLEKRRTYRDSLAPRFYGVVLEKGRGSEIIGQFRPNPLFAVGLALSLLVSGLLALPSSAERHLHPGLLITPIAFLSTAAMIAVTRWLGRDEKALLSAHVQACCRREA